MKKIKNQFLSALLFAVCLSASGQSFRSIDLNLNDTIYVSKIHISYLDPRGIVLHSGEIYRYRLCS